MTTTCKRCGRRQMAQTYCIACGWPMWWINRARERGEWPFTLPRPGWDAQNAAASDEERNS